VLDGGYPSTAPMIMASIAKLGFNINDVRVLLNSEPHPDHGGGLGALQQTSGAELWASEASAHTLASGGDDPDAVLPLRALVWIGVLGYPKMRVDHRFKDETQSASGRSQSPRTSPEATRAGAPRGRSRFVTETACSTS
jgi:metallo-beta-lactamase class B